MNKTAESIINNSTIEEQAKFCLEMLFELDDRIENLEELYLRHNYLKSDLIKKVIK